jgi:LysR family hydrogen peroxide-inducible transcriptional activator
MVASGLGITVVPRSSVDNRPDQPSLLVARPLARPEPQRRIILAWRKTFPRVKAIAAVREAVLASAMKGVTFVKDAQPESVRHV